MVPMICGIKETIGGVFCFVFLPQQFSSPFAQQLTSGIFIDNQKPIGDKGL